MYEIKFNSIQIHVYLRIPFGWLYQLDDKKYSTLILQRTFYYLSNSVRMYQIGPENSMMYTLYLLWYSHAD